MKDDAKGDMGCYLGVDDKGVVVSACVDNPEHRKDVAKFCADTIKEGCVLSRCKVRDLWEGRVKLYEPLPVI